jgi:hypothetical protein
VHDFEPGIKPSGLFWTIPIDRSAVALDSASGKARFHMENVSMPDFHDFFSAIQPSPPSVPGTVSFDVAWTGGGDHSRIRDVTFDYAGEFISGAATIDFRASVGGSTFASDPQGQVTAGPPGVGRERNGVFFYR